MVVGPIEENRVKRTLVSEPDRAGLRVGEGQKGTRHAGCEQR